MRSKEWHNKISGKIFKAALEVHKDMGPGLLESVYKHCMVDELHKMGIKSSCQVYVPLCYKGKELNKDFRIDILVENEIIIEVKAVEEIHPIYEAQLLSYLKISGKWLGILVNFNVLRIKDGYRRFVNGYIK